MSNVKGQFLYIVLSVSIATLEKIEVLNTSLQNSRLNITEAQAQVKRDLEGLNLQREKGFDQL